MRRHQCANFECARVHISAARLLTAQTATVQQTAAADPLKILLPVIRNVQKGVAGIPDRQSCPQEGTVNA